MDWTGDNRPALEQAKCLWENLTKDTSKLEAWIGIGNLLLAEMLTHQEKTWTQHKKENIDIWLPEQSGQAFIAIARANKGQISKKKIDPEGPYLDKALEYYENNIEPSLGKKEKRHGYLRLWRAIVAYNNRNKTPKEKKEKDAEDDENIELTDQQKRVKELMAMSKEALVELVIDLENIADHESAEDFEEAA